MKHLKVLIVALAVFAFGSAKAQERVRGGDERQVQRRVVVERRHGYQRDYHRPYHRSYSRSYHRSDHREVIEPRR